MFGLKLSKINAQAFALAYCPSGEQSGEGRRG
jgi:hypothetical protein